MEIVIQGGIHPQGNPDHGKIMRERVLPVDGIGLMPALGPVVCALNRHSVAAGRYPFAVANALMVQVREEGRVHSQSLFLAQEVAEAGRGQMLALMVDSESESSCSEFFAGLKARGLQGVVLMVPDDHSGLVRAVRAKFQGVVTWQRCQTYLTRNILNKTPKTLRSDGAFGVLWGLNPGITQANELYAGRGERI